MAKDRFPAESRRRGGSNAIALTPPSRAVVRKIPNPENRWSLDYRFRLPTCVGMHTAISASSQLRTCRVEFKSLTNPTGELTPLSQNSGKTPSTAPVVASAYRQNTTLEAYASTLFVAETASLPAPTPARRCSTVSSLLLRSFTWFSRVRITSS
jgi:hypothetical protein